MYYAPDPEDITNIIVVLFREQETDPSKARLFLGSRQIEIHAWHQKKEIQ